MSEIDDIEKLAQDVVNTVKEFFRSLLRKYWYLIVLFAIGLVGAFIGAILVEWEVINGYGVGSWYFNDFSVGAIILFCLLSIGWIILLVGLPFLGYICLVLGVWWLTLSPENKGTLKNWIKEEERKDKKREHRKKKAKQGGGTSGISAITTLAFLIIVFIDGNWFVTFANLPFSYFVYTYLLGLVWIVGIAGVVFAIVGIFWLMGKIK
jgi:hypothetical protein